MAHLSNALLTRTLGVPADAVHSILTNAQLHEFCSQ